MNFAYQLSSKHYSFTYLLEHYVSERFLFESQQKIKELVIHNNLYIRVLWEMGK